MIPIEFEPRLSELLPGFLIGVVEARGLRITPHDVALWSEIDAVVSKVSGSLRVEQIPDLPQVAGLRQAYRALGKDPTRYRGSQESLLRRVLKGKGLYQINTVVDINNLVSLESRHSAGTFDAGRVEPPVVLRAGRPGETYYGIGRDLLNVEALPLLVDTQGPFGSPTSDSERTKVTIETTHTLTTILSFAGPQRLAEHCRRFATLLCRYAGAASDQVQTYLLSSDNGREAMP
jgi:DNA/RNA-binding domain of Phe-tRNA-synthetase-like protein